MSQWIAVTLETDDSEEVREKLISKAKEEHGEEVYPREVYPEILDENRVYTRSEIIYEILFGERSSGISYSGFLNDRISRASIAWCDDTGEEAVITLYNVKDDEVSVLDKVFSDRTSDFQFEYLYLRYGFKLSQHRMYQHKFGKFDNIDELYSEYDVEQGSERPLNCQKYIIKAGKE